jgi:hypothetical protein
MTGWDYVSLFGFVWGGIAVAGMIHAHFRIDRLMDEIDQ